MRLGSLSAALRVPYARTGGSLHLARPFGGRLLVGAAVGLGTLALGVRIGVMLLGGGLADGQLR